MGGRGRLGQPQLLTGGPAPNLSAMRNDSLTRREALAVIAGGVGVAACGPEGGGAGADAGTGTPAGADASPAAETPIWTKDPSPLVQHGTNLETRLEDLDGFLTPNELFFVRNHSPTPEVDAASYVLTVGGPGAEA